MNTPLIFETNNILDISHGLNPLRDMIHNDVRLYGNIHYENYVVISRAICTYVHSILDINSNTYMVNKNGLICDHKRISSWTLDDGLEHLLYLVTIEKEFWGGNHPEDVSIIIGIFWYEIKKMEKMLQKDVRTSGFANSPAKRSRIE